MRTAIDRLTTEPDLLQNFGKIGIVANQAVVSGCFRTAVDLIVNATQQTTGSTVVAVFGPQHGYYQTEQDNMRETPDGDILLPDGRRVPLYSLYAESRIPSTAQMVGIDTLVVDLVDIGCRIYTYMQTLAAALLAAQSCGCRVVVLDRPNPLGLSYKLNETWHRVEGNLLDLRWESFVGWYPIPMRHGLSLGELGAFFKEFRNLNVSYSVIKAENLTRRMSPAELANEPWSIPSPNMPAWLSAWFFPSFVALEATNISEGRGTTLPFQIVGAPWMQPEKVAFEIERWGEKYKNHPSMSVDGTAIRRHDFRPTFNKHAGDICHGLHFHRLHHSQANLFALGMVFLSATIALHPEGFVWKAPGYEYNYIDPPIALILGSQAWLDYFISVQNGHKNWQFDLENLLSSGHQEAVCFAEATRHLHLYPETE